MWGSILFHCKMEQVEQTEHIDSQRIGILNLSFYLKFYFVI
jgi:hypothetical protein